MNDELERLMREATRLPWEVDGEHVHISWIEYGTEAGCCGQFTRHGECCGNAIPVPTEELAYHEIARASDADAALIVAAVNALPELLAVKAENERLREALTTISLVGGNMPDAHFETKTGPNDAMMRGGMFVTCRAIARAALNQETTHE